MMQPRQLNTKFSLLKKYVAYDPNTHEFLGFYNEGRKDMPTTVAEIDADTCVEQIGQNNKYNPETKLFYTDQAEINERNTSRQIRIRDAKLNQSDKYMLSDFPITGPQKIEMRQYRQALRNFPKTGIMPDTPDFFIG